MQPAAREPGGAFGSTRFLIGKRKSLFWEQLNNIYPVLVLAMWGGVEIENLLCKFLVNKP